MKEYRVGLMFGGPSAEHGISLMSARSVYSNVDIDEIEWLPLAITREGFWLDVSTSSTLLNGDEEVIPDCNQKGYTSRWDSIRSNFPENIDLVFPLLHGPFGEDGTIQGFLQTAGIPYIGSGIAASAAGMDKVFIKDILEAHGLPQASYITLSRGKFQKYNDGDKDELENRVKEKFGYPCFVKPSRLGSSLGISRIEKRNELVSAIELAIEYDSRIIIEEEICGREIECAVLGSWHDCRVSLPGEIIPGGEFYDYEAKYFSDETVLLAPADLDEDKSRRIKELARQVFFLIRGKGLARVDFFLNENNKVFINEINTMPGFTEKSMYPRMWKASGMSYSQLVKNLVLQTLKDREKDRK